MGAYVLRRILWAIPLLLFVSIVVYGLLELSPGGPTSMYMRRGSGISAADLANLEASLGLNDPFYIKYLRWLGRVVQGDFGMATTSPRPVIDEIADRLPNTLYLMGAAWIVSLLIAIPIGIFSAVKQYSKFDHFVTALTFIGQSIPSFFLGLLLLLVFYMRLDNPFTGGPLLPSGGVKTIGENLTGFTMIKDRLVHLVLPVTMLSATWIAWYSRFLRASMLETLHLDYVRTGHAKGLRERAVIWRHAFRNAAIPLITLMALDIPLLFTGALFAEVIFSWPGMGRLFYQAAERRDYGLLMAIIMITSLLIILANILADIAYRFLDPRIKLKLDGKVSMTDISEPVASRLTLDRTGPARMPDQGLRSRPQAMWRVYTRRFFRHRFAAAGLVVLVLVTLSAVFAPLITQDPNALSASDRKAAPSMEHWFGTDEAGRDIFARTIHGGRISLAVGISATGVALVIGTLVGAVSGFFGGLVDAVLMRLTDAFLCFPQLFVLIVFGTLMRTTELRVLQGNMVPIAIIIGLLSWMGLARIVRATFLSLREQDYVEAARSVGAGNARIMFRHVLPGAVGPIVVQATLLIAVTIITESGLSYLGFGVQPPTSSWGNLLEGAKPFLQTLPVYAIAPGMMIFLTVMSINFVGDGLRDALDPHSQR